MCQILGWAWYAALPLIPIPLLPEDGEIQLNLASAFRDAYEPAYYDQRLPYDTPLRPLISRAEMEQARTLASK